MEKIGPRERERDSRKAHAWRCRRGKEPTKRWSFSNSANRITNSEEINSKTVLVQGQQCLERK